MSIWPATLPQEQFLHLTDKRQDARVRTQNDVGPTKMRRRFTAATRDVTVPIVVTGAQRQVFDAFYIVTLQEGSLAFDWEDPVTDEIKAFRFRPPPPEWELALGGTPDKRLWRGMLNLEIVPVGATPAGTGDTMTPQEIEAAYNSQVAIMTQAEAEVGTSTTVRRVHALLLKQSVLAHAPAGGGGGMTSAEVEAAYNAQVPIISQAEAAAGVLTAVRRITPERIKDAITALAPTGGTGSTLFLSVKDFGATGNGTTNDAPACQAALDAAAGGGAVIFPRGTYRVAATLLVDSNTTVSIFAGATVIAANGLNGHVFTTKTGGPPTFGVHSRIRFTGSGGIIDGNKANQTPVSANYNCIYLPSVFDTVVDGDLTVQNATGHGLFWSLSGTQRGNRVHGVRCRNCGLSDLNPGGSGLACSNTLDFEITDVTSTGNFRGGLRLHGKNIVVTGCVCTGNHGTGLSPSSAAEGSSDLTVNGTICSDNDHDGMLFTGSHRVAISNVICEGNGFSGIRFFNGAEDCVVMGAILRNNGQDPAARNTEEGRDGITIKNTGTPCQHITIDGVICLDDQGVKTQEYSLALEDTTNWITIGGNCNFHGSAATILNTTTGTNNRYLRGIVGLQHDFTNRAGATVTGTAAETTLLSQVIPGNTIGVRGHMRIRGAGTVSGTAGSKTIRFRLGSLASIVISGQTAADEWSFVAEVLATSATGARVHLLGYEGSAGATINTQHVSTATVDWTAAQDVRCTAQLTNAADSVTQLYVTFEVLQ